MPASISSSASVSPPTPPLIFPATLSSSSSTNASNSASSSTQPTSLDACTAITSSNKATPAGTADTPIAMTAHRGGRHDPAATPRITTRAKPFGAGWKSAAKLLPLNKQSHLPHRDMLNAIDQKTIKKDMHTVQLSLIDTRVPTPLDFERKPPVKHYEYAYESPIDLLPTTPTECQSNGIDDHTAMPAVDVDLSNSSLLSKSIMTDWPSGLSHYNNLPSVHRNDIHRSRATSFDHREALDVPNDALDAPYELRELRRVPWTHLGSPSQAHKLSNSKSMPAMPAVGEGRNVFVHRVPDTLTEGQLRAYAAEFGDVVSVKVPAHTNKPHGFVMFKRSEQAQRFIAELQSREIDCEFGKEDYQVHTKALEDPNSANLYIAGLPTNIPYDEIAALISPAKICSWKPLVDEIGNRRGPIMARLQTRPQAEDVIRRLNGKYYPGMSERLQVRIADSDEQKHYKRQQSLWRDRVAPGVTSANGYSEHYIPPDDVPVLLDTREYLASQLQAIEHKLARSSLGRSPCEPQRGTDLTGLGTGIILPSANTWSGYHHRHTSSTFSADSDWSWLEGSPPGVIGPAPRRFLPGSLPPLITLKGHSRHPAVDFSARRHTQSDAEYLETHHPLAHVRSTPDLNGQSDHSLKRLWGDV